MPATRPIVRDPLEGPGESLEDKYRVKQRERGHSARALALASNPLGNALAGFRTAAPGHVRGGTFAPRATSGML